MLESFIAVTIFWATFTFSPGPFWAMIMEEAKRSDFRTIYKDYVIYQIVGWIPSLALVGFSVITLGKMNPDLLNGLYFAGAGVIFYMSWKVLQNTPSKRKKLNFNWKNMCLISWTNPKVWLTIPSGFLAANYTENPVINLMGFYLNGFPMFFFCLYLWGMIGRQSGKVFPRTHLFNSLLLALFACYLLYEGIVAVTGY